jgi:hypothetical protein
VKIQRYFKNFRHLSKQMSNEGKRKQKISIKQFRKNLDVAKIGKFSQIWNWQEI